MGAAGPQFLVQTAGEEGLSSWPWGEGGGRTHPSWSSRGSRSRSQVITSCLFTETLSLHPGSPVATHEAGTQGLGNVYFPRCGHGAGPE